MDGWINCVWRVLRRLLDSLDTHQCMFVGMCAHFSINPALKINHITMEIIYRSQPTSHVVSMEKYYNRYKTVPVKSTTTQT